MFNEFLGVSVESEVFWDGDRKTSLEVFSGIDFLDLLLSGEGAEAAAGDEGTAHA